MKHRALNVESGIEIEHLSDNRRLIGAARCGVYILLSHPGGGVKQEIDASLLLVDLLENRLELSGRRHVARERNRCRDLLRDGLNERPRLVLQVGDDGFGIGVEEVLRRRLDQVELVGEAGDKALAAVKVKDFELSIFAMQAVPSLGFLSSQTSFVLSSSAWHSHQTQ